MSPSSLRLACLAWVTSLAAICPAQVMASCSRTIAAAYMAPVGATVYRALPEQGLPSLTDGVAAASGCAIRVLSLPTTRVLRDFAEGQLDVIFVAIETDDRDRIGEFALGGTSPWVLVTSRTADKPPRRVDELIGNHQLLLGVARGAAYPVEVLKFVDQMKSSGQIDESADFDMALTKLANGRDAAVLMIADAYAALMASGSESRFQAFPQPALTPSRIGTYFNRQSLSAEDRAALLLGLRKVMASGLADKLLQARVPTLGTPEPKSH